jgi:uroporphyrin-III C-methyltransferase/precorrin-2 dehydrogenase/sirohydrochlorin ferrochelatase
MALSTLARRACNRQSPLMAYAPIFLDLSGRRVLIVGTGDAADRRAESYAQAGATIIRTENFDPAILPGCALAAGAGAPEAELYALSAEAQRLGIPVNIVDRPELSSFITPSTIERGPLTIAVSTGGAAPVLARLIRQKIEVLVAPGWARLAALAGRMQAETRTRLPDVSQRRRTLERIFSGPITDLALAGDEAGAEAAYRAELAAPTTQTGFVHLVGAGPGAADLVSLRALRLLGEADVIVHDRLGTEEVLALARRDATRIDVGKAQGDHTMPQADINALLIRLARDQKRVVRLKGGDPFVFGRGGEEVAALTHAGIPHAVTPGITAALACAASAKVPLTHRDHAHAVTFVTAHRRRPDLGIDYAGLLRPGVTLAIYMGLATITRLRDELEAAGFDPGMPAVLVEHGGTDHARVLRGPLTELADQAAVWAGKGPVLILLGGSAAVQ